MLSAIVLCTEEASTRAAGALIKRTSMETEAAGAVAVLHVCNDESAGVALRGHAWTGIHICSQYHAATGIDMRPQASSLAHAADTDAHFELKHVHATNWNMTSKSGAHLQ